MYRTTTEFLDDWAAESQKTRKVLERLEDQALGQRVAPGHRTLGRIAWHIACTIPQMASLVGLPLGELSLRERDIPETAAAIREGYDRASQALAEAARRELADAALGESVSAFGHRWSRAQVLDMLVRHEIHHRGQMTVLMRQAGLPIPGVYGPSKDERPGAGA